MILVVVTLLVTATAVTDLLARMRPDLKLDEIQIKIRSWWVMAGLFLFAVTVDNRLAYGLVGLICYLSLKEYFTIIPTTSADRGALFWAYLTVPIQFYWIASGWFMMAILFIPVYVFLILPARQILAGETTEFVARTARILWGVVLFVFSLSHLALFLSLGTVDGRAVGGRELLLYVVFLTEVNDVGSFLTGTSLGRHKISPKVSPNKTWEGFLGGLAVTVAGAVLLRFLTPFAVSRAAFAGLCIAIAGFFGDLCVSAVKRDVGVKDSGDFVPGHGGILDRVDSLTYTAPLFFHYVRYLYY
ncbi:MAG: phosphatidate cytidylyltransferase [Candidatus Riflebacteria bacterium]|nr:phosphatidate cytidylyltransferase [Candidatus Riflebacteria bacterium]